MGQGFSGSKSLKRQWQLFDLSFSDLIGESIINFRRAMSADTALFYFVSFHYNTPMKYGIYAITADMKNVI